MLRQARDAGKGLHEKEEGRRAPEERTVQSRSIPSLSGKTGGISTALPCYDTAAKKGC